MSSQLPVKEGIARGVHVDGIQVVNLKSDILRIQAIPWLSGLVLYQTRMQ
jgi:hypothetical protein